MPLPLTVSCFSKIHIGFTFLVPAHPGGPGSRAVKRVFVRPFVTCSTSSGADEWLTLRYLTWRRRAGWTTARQSAVLSGIGDWVWRRSRCEVAVLRWTARTTSSWSCSRWDQHDATTNDRRPSTNTLQKSTFVVGCDFIPKRNVTKFTIKIAGSTDKYQLSLIDPRDYIVL